MATKTFCDGCACEATDDVLTTVGRYDPCVYCPECLAVWMGHVDEARALHAQMVRAFEAAHGRLRAALKQDENTPAPLRGRADGDAADAPPRPRLARLPDED